MTPQQTSRGWTARDQEFPFPDIQRKTTDEPLTPQTFERLTVSYRLIQSCNVAATSKERDGIYARPPCRGSPRRESANVIDLVQRQRYSVQTKKKQGEDGVVSQIVIIVELDHGPCRPRLPLEPH